MRTVAGGELAGDPRDGPEVLGGARARHSSRAGAEADPVAGHRCGMRVLGPEPSRGSGGGGTEVHVDPRLREKSENVIQLAEVVLALTRLDHRPGEDVDAHEVDPGLLHQL